VRCGTTRFGQGRQGPQRRKERMSVRTRWLVRGNARWGASHLVGVLLGIGIMTFAPMAFAYPEFQAYVQEHAPRNVNCAMCHAHPDGPEGLKPGQIGSLTLDELDRLNRARGAFEPGTAIDNPILNAFGDRIVEQLGKHRILELRQDPGALADELGYESDLDGDGIPDAREYLAGTHPLDPHSGEPWLLFVHNLKGSWFHLAMLVLATGFGLFGLNNLLRWFERIQDS
jgi:hypothetical protein